MEFKQSLEIGKTAESFAESYFKKKNLEYKDVRNDRKYQRFDVDYVVDGYRYEVKKNYHNAVKGHKGFYFWVELSIDDKYGWYYINKTDYFFFTNCHVGIIIKNDDKFRNIINNFIENGNHSEYGKNRFDYIKDKRCNGYVTAKCMRVYIDDLSDIEILKVAKRK